MVKKWDKYKNSDRVSSSPHTPDLLIIIIIIMGIIIIPAFCLSGDTVYL